MTVNMQPPRSWADIAMERAFWSARQIGHAIDLSRQQIDYHRRRYVERCRNEARIFPRSGLLTSKHTAELMNYIDSARHSKPGGRKWGRIKRELSEN